MLETPKAKTTHNLSACVLNRAGFSKNFFRCYNGQSAGNQTINLTCFVTVRA